jgi:nicotinate-nucleotide adenylyltransferase
MNRIGIYGGTFDPPHAGHIAIARQALKQLSLTRLYFVPACIPPHKTLRPSTPAKHRLAMVKLATAGQKEFQISAVELQRRGVSYTIDTLKYFRKRFPSAELILIIGADNLAQFDAWKSPKEILKLASLAVYKRRGFNRSLMSKKTIAVSLKGRIYPISSTEIRKKLKKELSVSRLISKPVFKYIQDNSLYRSDSKTVLERKHEINCAHR